MWKWNDGSEKKHHPLEHLLSRVNKMYNLAKINQDKGIL